MKRSIVAVAALAACASAAAQVPASLTIYGGVDGNVTRITAGSKGSQWQMRDGGMYVTKLGFTGSEDLGGGYRAHFIMESQSSSDTGAAATTNTTNSTSGNTTLGGLTWNRKVTVSLFTPVGEARLGRRPIGDVLSDSDDVRDGGVSQSRSMWRRSASILSVLIESGSPRSCDSSKFRLSAFSSIFNTSSRLRSS